MKRCKSYSILLTGLVLLLASSIVACGPESPVAESPPPQQPPPREQVGKKPAKFEVGPLAVAPGGPMVGDSAAVTTTVTNTGDVSGVYTATLQLDGEELETKDVSVGAKGTQLVSFQTTRTTAGTYELTIGESTATMTVYDWCPYTIRYYTGPPLWAGVYVSGDWGQIVHFTPLAKPFRIQKIMVFAYAEVEDFADWDRRHFTVRIWDEGKHQQLWSQDFPWSLFKGLGGWEEIEVPDIRAAGDFHVEIVTYSDPPPAKSYMAIYCVENEEVTRSGISYMGAISQTSGYAGKDKDWLIRVEGEGAPCLLSYDGGEPDGTYWMGDRSYLVHFSLPSAPFKIQKIMIYGYAAFKDEEACRDRRFTLTVWDKATGAELWSQDFPWELFGPASAKDDWRELEVPGIVCTGDFDVELTTNSTDACRIMVGHDSSAPNSHSDMSRNGKVTPWQSGTWEGVEYTREKTNWMIRVEGLHGGELPAQPLALSGPLVYEDDFSDTTSGWPESLREGSGRVFYVGH